MVIYLSTVKPFEMLLSRQFYPHTPQSLHNHLFPRYALAQPYTTQDLSEWLKDEFSKFDCFHLNVSTYRQALSSLVTRHESIIHRTKQQRIISPLMDQFGHSRLTHLIRYMDNENGLSDLGNLSTHDYLLGSEDWQFALELTEYQPKVPVVRLGKRPPIGPSHPLYQPSTPVTLILSSSPVVPMTYRPNVPAEAPPLNAVSDADLSILAVERNIQALSSEATLVETSEAAITKRKHLMEVGMEERGKRSKTSLSQAGSSTQPHFSEASIVADPLMVRDANAREEAFAPASVTPSTSARTRLSETQIDRPSAPVCSSVAIDDTMDTPSAIPHPSTRTPKLFVSPPPPFNASRSIPNVIDPAAFGSITLNDVSASDGIIQGPVETLGAVAPPSSEVGPSEDRLVVLLREFPLDTQRRAELKRLLAAASRINERCTFVSEDQMVATHLLDSMGDDVLLQFRPGFGKTFVWAAAGHLPRMKEKFTLCVTPNKALMDDLVANCRSFGFAARKWSSGQGGPERIIIVSPENFFGGQFAAWLNLHKSALGRVVIEEAHLWVSTSFRRDVLRSFDLCRKDLHPSVQWVSSTATCPQPLQGYLVSMMGSDSLVALQSPSIPPEHRLSVHPETFPRVDRHLIAAIERHIKDAKRDGRLIEKDQVLVFMPTTADVDMIDRQLGWPHGFYRGTKVPPNVTAAMERNFEEFRNGNMRCLAATNAAAQGVNFPHLALIILAGTQSDVIEMVQKLGRAGRTPGTSARASSVVFPTKDLGPVSRRAMEDSLVGIRVGQEYQSLDPTTRLPTGCLRYVLSKFMDAEGVDCFTQRSRLCQYCETRGVRAERRNIREITVSRITSRPYSELLGYFDHDVGRRSKPVEPVAGTVTPFRSMPPNAPPLIPSLPAALSLATSLGIPTSISTPVASRGALPNDLLGSIFEGPRTDISVPLEKQIWTMFEARLAPHEPVRRLVFSNDQERAIIEIIRRYRQQVIGAMFDRFRVSCLLCAIVSGFVSTGAAMQSRHLELHSLFKCPHLPPGTTKENGWRDWKKAFKVKATIVQDSAGCCPQCTLPYNVGQGFHDESSPDGVAGCQMKSSTPKRDSDDICLILYVLFFKAIPGMVGRNLNDGTVAFTQRPGEVAKLLATTPLACGLDFRTFLLGWSLGLGKGRLDKEGKLWQ